MFEVLTWTGCAEQYAAVCKGVTAPAVWRTIRNGERGPNVNEEAAQKLLGGDGHDFLLAAVCIVSFQRKETRSL